jgi:Fe-S-cluster containining protein
MNKIELNLEKISTIAKQKERENIAFRTFLKMQDEEKIDTIVHSLHKKITAQIDCRKCANCCSRMSAGVTVTDIRKLAALENISAAEFEQRFLELDKSVGITYLKDVPCRYLKDKSCSIYKDRPEDCKSYPHTQKNDFTSRIYGVIGNCEICPIVFNLYEQLKQELQYHSRRKKR